KKDGGRSCEWSFRSSRVHPARANVVPLPRKPNRRREKGRLLLFFFTKSLDLGKRETCALVGWLNLRTAGSKLSDRDRTPGVIRLSGCDVRARVSAGYRRRGSRRSRDQVGQGTRASSRGASHHLSETHWVPDWPADELQRPAVEAWPPPAGPSRSL